MSYGYIPNGVTVGQRVGDTFNHPRDGSGFAGATDINDPTAQWILVASAHDPVSGPPDILPNTSAGFGGVGSVGPLRTNLRGVATATDTEAVSEKAVSIAIDARAEAPFWSAGNVNTSVRVLGVGRIYSFVTINASSNPAIDPMAASGAVHWMLKDEFSSHPHDPLLGGYYEAAINTRNTPIKVEIGLDENHEIYFTKTGGTAADYANQPGTTNTYWGVV